MKKTMLIGELAKKSGCDVQTVRYYEKIGLLPIPNRTPGNQRFYLHDHQERLIFIRHCRSLGFPLEQIRKLIEVGSLEDQYCTEINTITEQCLLDVQEKINRLEGLKTELQRILSSCSGGTVSSCNIIKSLSNHQECLIRNHETGSPILEV